MRNKMPLRTAAVSTFLMLAFSTCLPAWSQPLSTSSIDRATREIDRSTREQAEKALRQVPRKPAGPEEAIPEVSLTGPKLFVKEIRLEGVESFPVEKFAPIIRDYEDRDVYETEIKDALTGKITREYLKNGVIATCFVPPQEIAGGVVTLRVVEAKMGDLRVTKARYFVTKRLDYYWPIDPGRVLRYDVISRALQFMNKDPDREVKATLLPGTKPGTTDVLLTQRTSFPAHFTASMDNEGSVSTGKMRTGIGIVENNAIGLDDTFLAGYTGGKDFGGVYLYHKVPITPFGTTVMYGYSNTRAFPKKDFEQYAISSNADSASVFLYQDLYQKDEYRGEVSAGIEKKNKRVVAESSGLPAGFGAAPGSTGDLNVDRLTIMRLGASLVDRKAESFAYVKPEWSQGLNFLGARRLNPLSSRQAGNCFSKLSLNAQYVRRFIKNIQAQFKFSGQAASEKLTPQEELYMGGIDSIRGYPSGDYLADSGFASNFELQVPPWFLPDWAKAPYGRRPLKDEILGVFFFDFGMGSKRGMIQGEQSERRMGSVGAGVRLRLLDQANARFEWAVPLDPMVNRPITEGGGNRPRLHFAIDLQDRLPEEVEYLSGRLRQERLLKDSWNKANREIKDPNSVFTRKLFGLYYLAEKAEAAGDLEKARKYYGKVSYLGRSAQSRAETYLETMRPKCKSVY